MVIQSHGIGKKPAQYFPAANTLQKKSFNFFLHDLWARVLYRTLQYTHWKESYPVITNDDPKPLAASRLGLHLTAEEAEAIGRLGSQTDWPAGAMLCRRGDYERVLYVVVDGEIDYGNSWLGAGGYLGELGFLLGVPRTANLQARVPSRTWSLDAETLRKYPRLATMLIIALVRELPARLRKFQPDQSETMDFCDDDHPAIRSLAHVLLREDEISTAAAIWSFVRAMPYRFGPWWQKASETLRLGWGMCTTKSNLEVALFRAAGLEAGFAESRIDANLVEPLVSASLRSLIHRRTYHTMGAVRLAGRWHVADCAFPDIVLEHLAKKWPQLCRALEKCPRLDLGSPFHPLALTEGRDPFDEVIVHSISESMRKRSSFDVDQLELLNLVNDKLQQVQFHQESPWLTRIQSCLQHDPREAMQMALATAAVLASELHKNIKANYAL